MKAKPARTFTPDDTWADVCPSHKPSRLSYPAAHFDADRRIARGQRQRQCAKCKRWFWKHEQGPCFVPTDRPDTEC